MGTWYSFVCPNCDYHAEVSGGRDCGFRAEIETKGCTACREVVDVLVGHSDSSPVEPGELNRCSSCNGTEVVPWDNTWPCPRCGGGMERSEEPIAHWD